MFDFDFNVNAMPSNPSSNIVCWAGKIEKLKFVYPEKKFYILADT